MVKKLIKASTFGLIDLDKDKDKLTDTLPTEDPSVRVLRERQIRELAELDEEENRRLKSAFRNSRGIRAFRRSGGGSGSGGGSVSSSSGRTGQRAFTRSGRTGGVNP